MKRTNYHMAFKHSFNQQALEDRAFCCLY